MIEITPAKKRSSVFERAGGLLLTLGLHGVLVGWYLFQHARASADKGPALGNYVDAELVRFGKPRDLSFLPHKVGSSLPAPDALHIASDTTSRPAPPAPVADKVDPLKSTRAELFKNLTQDEGADTADVGSLSGSRAGTATEARGDPYILSLVDQIGTAWTVPTTISERDLARLDAEVCLKIASTGRLVQYEFVRRSGNSQFDSSLEATLSTIRELPVPPDRFRTIAERGRLCATFHKEGK